MKLEDYPSKTYDKLRYGDTDRQGHVNNAVFATFCETGRIGALQDAGLPVVSEAFSIVTARICIDYRKEIFWPGTVEIGSAIKSIGRSSVTMSQGLFQNGECVATVESVMVLIDNATHRPAAIDAETKNKMQFLMLDLQS